MTLSHLWFLSKLKYFSNDQRIILLDSVTKEAYDALSSDQKKMFKYLFSFLDTATTQTSINSVYDYCREVFIEGKGPYIFVINQGEDGKIVETKQAGADYTGYNIIVREDSTDLAITANNIAGGTYGAQPSADLTYTNFPLAKGGIYRLRVQLEHTNNGIATGNAHLVIATAYVIVPMKADGISGTSGSGTFGTLTNATP